MSITDPCNWGHTHFRNLAQSNPTKRERERVPEMLAQRERSCSALSVKEKTRETGLEREWEDERD